MCMFNIHYRSQTMIILSISQHIQSCYMLDSPCTVLFCAASLLALIAYSSAHTAGELWLHFGVIPLFNERSYDKNDTREESNNLSD